MQRGTEIEVHCVEKGGLSSDSDAPQVGSARSDWTRAVKVNRRKTNRHKTRPYCTCIAGGIYLGVTSAEFNLLLNFPCIFDLDMKKGVFGDVT